MKNVNVKSDYLSLRIEPKLKEDFYKFCDNSSISVSFAVNQLALKCIMKGSIPFKVKVLEYKIDNESGETYRISIRMKKEVREGFSIVCQKAGIPMSTAAKIFMRQCIEIGEFPFEV